MYLIPASSFFRLLLSSWKTFPNAKFAMKVQNLTVFWTIFLRLSRILNGNCTQSTLQKPNTKISKQLIPEKEYRGLSSNFHIHVSVRDLYIPAIGLPILLEEICRPILGLAHRHRNVEIGAETALFPEKEYISGIFVAVHDGIWQSPLAWKYCRREKMDQLSVIKIDSFSMALHTILFPHPTSATQIS
jgi:hypothetical protein